MAKYTRPIKTFAKINHSLLISNAIQNRNYHDAILYMIIKSMNHENNKLTTYPENITNLIALILGANVRVVQKHIKSLVDKGFINKIDQFTVQVDPFLSNKKSIVRDNLGYVSKRNPKPDLEVMGVFERMKKFMPEKKIDSKKGEDVNRMLRIIESQQRSLESMSEMKKMLVSLYDRMTPEEAEEVERHLKLVPSE